MATVNAYVPDSLKAEMDAIANQPNWSALFQEVAKAEIARAKATAGDRDALVARVLAKGSPKEQEGFDAGLEFARTWAEIDDFEVVAKYQSPPFDDYAASIKWKNICDELGCDPDHFFGDNEYRSERFLKGFARAIVETYNDIRPILDAA